MDFSLTTLFILPASNTLPTTGGPVDLVPGKFGVFRDDYSVATTGNIAASKYIYLAQGRIEQVPGLTTKKSDKIKAGQIIEWYKVPSIATSRVQISAVGYTGVGGNTDTITAHCDESYTLSLRLFSSYIDLAYFNGLTRSFTYQTECCDGCTTGDCGVADIPTMTAFFVNAINTDPLVSRYVTAATTANTTDPDNPLYGLTITGKALTKYGAPCDITAFPYEYDKLRFQVWAFKGADTSQDYLVYDRCENIPTATLQTSTYPSGSSDEIKLLEVRYYSYQTTHKHLFRWPIWNGAYSSYVVDGTFYDTYYIKFKDLELHTWNDYVDQDETVIIAVPAGQGTTLETLLTTYLGAVTSYITTAP